MRVTNTEDDSAYPYRFASPERRQYGCTKRELFAAMNMQGLLRSYQQPADPQTTAIDAVRFADSLIAELSKRCTS